MEKEVCLGSQRKRKKKEERGKRKGRKCVKGFRLVSFSQSPLSSLITPTHLYSLLLFFLFPFSVFLFRLFISLLFFFAKARHP